VGFYAANNFAVTSLGEKYPGVERFRVDLQASTSDRAHRKSSGVLAESPHL
jgi:hypothetical protein